KDSMRRWLYAYALPAVTGDDAREAISARPHVELGVTMRTPEYETAIGRVYRLAGDAEAAIPFFADAARSWNALAFPCRIAHAAFELGMARIAMGDVRGACSAFQVVITRWGDAKPPSATAKRARASSRALGCH